MKKCFSEVMIEIINKNNPAGKYDYLNLEKKKHKFNLVFIIDKLAKIRVINITHNNEIIKKDFSKLLESIIIKSPGYKEEEPASISYSIPMSIVIE